MAEGIEAILEERGERYGEFTNHAEITQVLKAAMLRGLALSEEARARVQSRVAMMDFDQVEALEMIAPEFPATRSRNQPPSIMR